MSAWIDLAIIVILALFIIAGYSKGIFATLMKIAAVILSYAGSKLIASYVGPVLADSFYKPELSYRISRELFHGSQLAELPENALDRVLSVLRSIGIQDKAASTAIELSDARFMSDAEDFVNSVSEQLANTFAGTAVAALSFIVLFITTLTFVDFITNIFKLPVLGRIDRVCGAFVGLCFGLLTVLVLCTAFTCLWPFISITFDTLPAIQTFTDKNPIFEFLIKNNFLTRMIMA